MSQMFSILAFLLAQSVFANPASQQLIKATEQAKRLIKNATVDSAKHYCLKGTLTCRSIFTYKTKTGIKIKHFVQVFMSSDRQVGSAGYFFPDHKNPGQYFRYEDMTFDGKIDFKDMTPPITVERTQDNSVAKMIGMRLDMLGTTQYVISNLIFGEDMVALEGVKYDTARPGFQEPLRIEYLRVHP